MNSFFKITVFALVDIISSCSLPSVKLGEITDFYSNEKSTAFNNFNTKVDVDKINSYFDTLFDIVAKNSSYASTDMTFVNNFNDLIGSFYKVMDGITINRTKYFDTADGEYKKAYLNYYDTYFEILNKYHDLLEACYHSNYREPLFGNMSNQEIEEMIASYKTGEEEKQYTLALEEFSNDAEEIYSKDYQSSNYEDEMFELLVKYIGTAKDYASYLNVDYLNYIYKTDYDRNYTTKEALSFYEAIKTELVPAANTYKTKLDNIKLNSSEQKFINLLETYNFRYYQTDILPAIEDYVYSIEPLSKAYRNLWSNNGIYCFSNNDDSLGTAFTSYMRTKDQPILFFSKNYQEAYTFLHEFGHYTSYYCSEGARFPMDISEMDSQGNELIFTSYLQDNYEKYEISQNVVDYLGCSKVYSQLTSIVNCAYVSEMEQIAYNYDLNDKDGFFRKINEVCNSYGTIARKKYWWAPALCNFGYYISYATSSIGALQFYISSRSDYESAVNKYSKFIKRTNSSWTIDEITDSVGLLQIYSEDAVKYIAEYLKK